MKPRDLGLLAALDVLLTEGSVSRAAVRMNLSAPAMSRILGRIRVLTGDPILVRAGRGLVPTPRAQVIREQLSVLMAEAQGLLASATDFDPFSLERSFSIRATDGFVTNFGGSLLEHLRKAAPSVVLKFMQQGDEDVAALRHGTIDLDISAIGESGPEIMVQTLFEDHFVGVVRAGHAILKDKITIERFCNYSHISASRRGRLYGPLDHALHDRGYKRHVAVTVTGFTEAVTLASQTDLIAIVPDRLTAKSKGSMTIFALPVQTTPVVISQAWHPRFQADPGHRWLRGLIRTHCMST
ncbi:LysR family transcriptional regulator [Saccharibacter sp. 17.LH.SD]|uniref:LysR family transcriptional regulator n=1 Tax=Saccharibacter sp. 17.LH.SD TaxID=2689393 RepID=UPI001371C863|nr:LysR family transcriptional regulator [Saccharibacter sp. 17.LH.SD]MXV45088.1 LysR family transcriptional regulator [Saccharibacter sp. 17.LH.SD]